MTPTTRLPGESAKAYQAFEHYADMGNNRTLAAVAEECKKSVSLINRWSARWHWKERIAALQVAGHRQQLDATAQAKLETARKREALALRVQERAALTFERMSDKADRFLQQPEDVQHVKDTKGRLVTRGGPSAANAAARLALAAGLPTSNARVTGKNGAPLGGMPPIIRNYVVTQESAKTREIRKRFGKRPPGL